MLDGVPPSAVVATVGAVEEPPPADTAVVVILVIRPFAAVVMIGTNVELPNVPVGTVDKKVKSVLANAYSVAEKASRQTPLKPTTLVLPRSEEDIAYLNNLHDKLDEAYQQIEQLTNNLNRALTINILSTENNSSNKCQKGMAMYFRKKRKNPKEPESSPNITIPVTDRLGRVHEIEDLIYAYYDSYTNDYIVLQSYPDHTGAIYGVYTKVDDQYGFIKVEGRVGTPPDIEIGSVVTVMNKLNLCAGSSNSIWGDLVDSNGIPLNRIDCADWQAIESNRN